MRVRKLTPPDRDAIVRILTDSGTFNDEEVRVALEVLDSALERPGVDYHALGAEDEAGAVGAYIAYGRTPMTEESWDLYWVATHPAARGKGLATRLVRGMEAEIQALGSGIVRIETSQLEAYGAARSFYVRAGYAEAGRIADFYKPGDDLVIFAKRLEARARQADGRGKSQQETELA